jgi:uncharacterized membrane protein
MIEGFIDELEAMEGIGMLDEAYDRFSDARDSFSPEEFTLYVMSQMLSLCEDAEEARQFRLGAATYIIRSASALPEDYAPIIADAQQMVRAEELARITAPEPATEPEPVSAGEAPTEQSAEAALAVAPEPAPDPAPMAAAQPSAATKAAPAARAGARPAADTVHRARRPSSGRSRSVFDYIEKGIVTLLVVGLLGSLLLYSSGMIELPYASRQPEATQPVR